MPQLPSTIWRTLSQRTRGKELPKGVDAVWDDAMGMLNRLVPRGLWLHKKARRVLVLEADYQNMGSQKLRDQCTRLREVFRRNRQKPEDLYRAYAIVREVASREIGQRPYPVQVAGALGLYNGIVIEMATGEGKTLTASLAAVAAGWTGKGCHIITFNDYLAGRDAELMEKIYRFCGLSVSSIQQEMTPPDRRQAYRADITYCTNKEVTADFLRDRLALGRIKNLPGALLAKIAQGSGHGTDRLVQRGLHYAIIDEADSILLDEAVTPLIISGSAPNDEQVKAFNEAMGVAGHLEADRDYRVDHRYREVRMTPGGYRRLEELTRQLGGVWNGARRREEMIVQALTAKYFYLRDKQYVVLEDKVVIVDDFTGRLMPDRNWRDGLHQAVEAKEQLEVNPPKDTFARISFQKFFRLYRKLAGMTGTAAEASREFWQIYHLPVVVIPTNEPCIRKILPMQVFRRESEKWQAIVEEIRRMHLQKRPVLIGTRSVQASEQLSKMLEGQGLDHQVLNAVRHKEEAEIVARAGIAGRITVATNMAGRGTDIKLGRGVAGMGGLHVIASERHESGRIDRQLFGRCARQGDPGSGCGVVSLEDELIRRYAARLTRGVLSGRTFDLAQNRAERMALRQRKGVLRTDDWLDEYLGFAGAEQ